MADEQASGKRTPTPDVNRKPDTDAISAEPAARRRQGEGASTLPEGPGDAEPGFGREGARSELGEPSAEVDEERLERVAEHNRKVDKKLGKG